MDADLEHRVLAAAAVAERAHRFAHAQCSCYRSVGSRECRHHRVAAGLDHGTALGGDDLVEDPEMRSDEIKGNQVTNTLIELGGTSEIGKQECQAGDLQALIDIDRVGAVDIAKDLI